MLDPEKLEDAYQSASKGTTDFDVLYTLDGVFIKDDVGKVTVYGYGLNYDDDLIPLTQEEQNKRIESFRSRYARKK